MEKRFTKGIATDDMIEAHRRRIMLERQMEESGIRPMPTNKQFSLSETGCSSFGERWTGHGWAYCINRKHCLAEATIREIASRRAK